MKCINANKLHRKSGGMGHPSFVRELEPMRLSSGTFGDDVRHHELSGPGLIAPGYTVPSYPSNAFVVRQRKQSGSCPK